MDSSSLMVLSRKAPCLSSVAVENSPTHSPMTGILAKKAGRFARAGLTSFSMRSSTRRENFSAAASTFLAKRLASSSSTTLNSASSRCSRASRRRSKLDAPPLASASLKVGMVPPWSPSFPNPAALSASRASSKAAASSEVIFPSSTILRIRNFSSFMSILLISRILVVSGAALPPQPADSFLSADLPTVQGCQHFTPFCWFHHRVILIPGPLHHIPQCLNDTI